MRRLIFTVSAIGRDVGVGFQVRSHSIKLAVPFHAWLEHGWEEPFFEDEYGAEIDAVVRAVAEDVE